MKAKINIDNSFGGIYTIDYIEKIEENDKLNFTEILPSENIILPIWNKNKWEEKLSQEEIETINFEKGVLQISKRDLFIKLLDYNITEELIKNTILENSNLTEKEKSILIIKLNNSNIFYKLDEDLLNLSDLIGISKNNLTKIFNKTID
ncbi:hypothetical protein BOX09_gp22 [Flavobacterium phage Fpv1]|uniref:Uncharacterized protein n=3 Tax=Fipvunavirus TaxID=2560132 RepID=A0A1B0WLN2_9CAUD|nr:hypothetical protein BOW81_gp22 [Flavobacterium phage Fpv20]YP_009322024.1 hypothetical protein BOX09_gp22 [Flavobacterium phage Fpv1]YP_009323613.1 hypothetical protein BOW82_gp22 [Flavobacterium phage Fpv2]YP_009594077.1 hypothetical protein FDG89_gp21 [Flavobacterium phage FpV4]ALN97268.1 hypothetical protein [Flavobacterium phage FpV21]QCW20321.1 hypothetical protein [Flavobacterium phage FPSV-F12]ALN97134.1 hypothetical protein [Flavobacterium phage FpV4]ANB40264.1 hypothetical prote